MKKKNRPVSLHLAHTGSVGDVSDHILPDRTDRGHEPVQLRDLETKGYPLHRAGQLSAGAAGGNLQLISGMTTGAFKT